MPEGILAALPRTWAAPTLYYGTRQYYETVLRYELYGSTSSISKCRVLCVPSCPYYGIAPQQRAPVVRREGVAVVAPTAAARG